MSSQIAANSIEALKDLRVALALYGEDTMGALGAVGAEVRRTMLWLEQDRPAFWQDQIKRRRERLAIAKAELFRKQLAQKPGSATSMSEQVEAVKRAEASLEDAEKRLILTRKWQTHFKQAVLEYRGTIQRIKFLASAEVPSAVNLLTRLIDSLEAYLRVSPTPPSRGESSSSTTKAAPAEFEAIAVKMIDDEPPAAETPAEEAEAESLAPEDEPSH